MNPKDKGDRSEAMILAVLLQAGKVVLQPFGDNQRYDLVIDDEGTFIRVQCKTGRVRDGVVRFNTCSSHHHRGKGWSDYRGQADVFGVYVPETSKVYLVPVEDVPLQRAHFRVDPARNGQEKGVRWGDKYEFPPT